MSRVVLLVRHTDVAVRWSSRCYGCSDIGLSRAGRKQAADLASQLAERPVTALVHSGLKRTSYLARWLGTLKHVTPVADVRWRERDFGAWEGRGWHTIWKETGNAMDGMFVDPHLYRPGGGETTAELYARTSDAWHALPSEGLIVVVTHGGPIAAVRTMLAGAPLTEIVNYRVGTGAIIEI